MLEYEAYKDSGAAWLGKIPYEWKTGVIGSLYTLRNTKVSDTDYPPLSVTMKGVVPQLENAAKTDAHDARKLVLKGDFAINSRSDRRGSCGISDYDGSVSLINIVLTPRGEMHPQYYNWLFHTVQFADEYYKNGHGIVDDLWTTRWNEMKRISIPIPSLTEQAGIADYLKRKISHIDSVIAEAKASIEEYKAWKASIIYEAVTKGLDLDVEMKDSGVEWIGMMPTNWQCLRFKLAANIKANLVDPQDYPDYPQVAPDNIMKDAGILLACNSVSESGVISWNHLFYKGQILYSKIRPTLNKVVIAPFDGLCSADMYPIETTQNTTFMLYVILSKYFVQQVALCTADRVKMPKINQEELANIQIALPPIAEQEIIANHLNTQRARFDSLISEKEALIADLESYKKSLIFEVVTGKRRVC